MKKHMQRREFWAEFLGTLILVFFANVITASGIFFHAWNSFFELSLITGFGVTLGIYIANPHSEAHLNPAITLAMAFWRGFPKSKILPYLFAQISGAFFGSLLTYGLFSTSIQAVSKGSVPQFFYTSAAPQVTHMQALLVETVLTAILTIVIFAVTDQSNKTIPQGPAGGLIIGTTIAILGSSFGSLTGFAMNPARDLGPRLFAFLAGWEGHFPLPEVNYLWVPIIGPVMGAFLGSLLYEKILSAKSIQESKHDSLLQQIVPTIEKGKNQSAL
jgi:glycerol uptake facilitator protein